MYGQPSLKEVAFLVLVELTCSNEKIAIKRGDEETSVVSEDEGLRRKLTDGQDSSAQWRMKSGECQLMRGLGGSDRAVCMMDFGLECSSVGDVLLSVPESLGSSLTWVLLLAPNTHTHKLFNSKPSWRELVLNII